MEGVDRGRDRVPPHDSSAEKAVLSAILLDNAAIREIAGQITADDFYVPAHRRLFGAMEELNDANQPVDLTTLSDYLKSRDLLDSIGGPMVLAEIADYEATAANVVYYKDIVRDKSIKRRVIETATEIVNLGFDPAEPSEQLLDEAESKIFAVGQSQAATSLSPLSEAVLEAADHIDVLMSRSGELTGVPTGFAAFDKETGGLQAGDLFVLAARPAMGKTALALNIARNAAIDYDKKIAIFSLEMTTRSLVLRLLSAEAEVDFAAFRSGLIAVEAHARLMSAAGSISDAKIFIDDSGAPSVLEIRAKSRRLHAREGGLDMVIVDYLQLAHGDRNTQSREQEISEISRGLKGLAKELDIPVIAVSQLNRGPETRKEDKRPMLSDLRESGAIEQDADVIGFIYRDVVYNRETEYEDLAELIIAKQRNGPTGTVKLKFEGRYARFSEWPLSDDPYDGASAAGGFVPPPAGSDEPF
ncbi:MAG: replicative DNA helicase [Myxococcota bacterium]